MMRYTPKDHLELPQRHRPVMRWQGLAFGLLVMVPFWVLVAALLWTFFEDLEFIDDVRRHSREPGNVVTATARG